MKCLLNCYTTTSKRTKCKKTTYVSSTKTTTAKVAINRIFLNNSVYNVHHCNWLLQWRHDPGFDPCSVLLGDVLAHPYQWRMFDTPPPAMCLTRWIRPNLSSANLTATFVLVHFPQPSFIMHNGNVGYMLHETFTRPICWKWQRFENGLKLNVHLFRSVFDCCGFVV